MIPQPPNKFLIAGHTEFGDALVLNGLVRVLARRHERIVWLTHTNYVRAVRQMMADVKNLEIMATLSYEEIRRRWLPVWPNALALGYFNNSGFDETRWDEEFYRQASVPSEARWTEFRMPDVLLANSMSAANRIHRTRGDFALVHEKADLGWTVRPEMIPGGLGIERIAPRPSILDWLPEVLAAKELHFIDSAFLNLAESLFALGHLKNTALCWHKYAKRYPGKAKWPVLRAPWRTFE